MSSFKILKWLFSRARSQLFTVILLVILSSVTSVLGICFAFLSKSVIDYATARNVSELIRYSCITVSIIVVQILLVYISNYISTRSVARLEANLKNHLFNEVTQKDFSEISSYHSGDILTRLTNDIRLIANYVITLLPNLISCSVTLILALLGLIKIDSRFGLIFLVGGLLYIIAVRSMSGFLKKLHKNVQKSESVGNSFFQESISNLLMIKVFGIEPTISKMSASLQDDVFKAKLKRSRVYVLSSSAANLLFSLGGLYALLWCAFKLTTGSITFGTLTAVMQLVNRVQSPVSGLSGTIPGIFSLLASSERIIDIENLTDESSSCNSINVKECYDNLTKIRFSNVAFSYNSEKSNQLSVIENADFSIPKGSFTVIGGHSGIGKSTILKLLLGVYSPTSGSISLVTKNKSINVGKHTRKMFAYVPQGNMLLSGTIRDSVKVVKPDATDEEIFKAAQISCASDFLIEHGLNAKIGENGLGLSEGQIQRLAITRAILSGSDILLLDEATSALDADTETKLLTNLKELKDKTCIIISHKPSAFKICDYSVSLKDGKISVSRLKNQHNY